MVDPLLVSGGIEILKLGIQFLIAQSRMQGLSDEEINKVLSGERDRFEKNISIPLADV